MSLFGICSCFRPYNAKRLVKDAREKSYGTDEAKDFCSALKDRASKGYTVKNSGCVVSGENIIFWALPERPEASSETGKADVP